MTFGSASEWHLLDAYSQMSRRTIVAYPDFFKRPIKLDDHGAGNGTIMVGGRVDGITLSHRQSSEAKTRMKRLFKTLLEYEHVQMHTYLYCFGAARAVLVQGLAGKDQSMSTSSFVVHWDDGLWNHIVHGLSTAAEELDVVASRSFFNKAISTQALIH